MKKTLKKGWMYAPRYRGRIYLSDCTVYAYREDAMRAHAHLSKGNFVKVRVILDEQEPKPRPARGRKTK